jgi:hypothetical protein
MLYVEPKSRVFALFGLFKQEYCQLTVFGRSKIQPLVSDFLDNLGLSSIFQKNQLLFWNEQNRLVLLDIGSGNYCPIVLILRKN